MEVYAARGPLERAVAVFAPQHKTMSKELEAWREAYLALLAYNWSDDRDRYEEAKKVLVELDLIRISHAGKVYLADHD